MKNERLDVRLLGTLRVIRDDGSEVDPESWRTGKTMDLVRILCLENGRPVRIDTLIDLLWPDADRTRGRGSLRTAASHIRRAVGFDCLRRHHDGLAVDSVSTDVDELHRLAVAVRQAANRADHDEVSLLVEAAELVYVDDFHASDDQSGWATRARDDLRRLRLTLLLDAAQSALDGGRFRATLELARVASAVDPSYEASTRLLMRAHAELGEVGQALRAFETYRSHLAEEFGVDPSRTTRELHLRLLQDPRL